MTRTPRIALLASVVALSAVACGTAPSATGEASTAAQAQFAMASATRAYAAFLVAYDAVAAMPCDQVLGTFAGNAHSKAGVTITGDAVTGCNMGSNPGGGNGGGSTCDEGEDEDDCDK